HRLQVESVRDPGLAGRARRLSCRGLGQARAGGPVDRAVDAPAAPRRGVVGVDDRVDLEVDDRAAGDPDPCHPRAAQASGLNCQTRRRLPSGSLNQAAQPAPTSATPSTVFGVSYSSKATPFARSAATSPRMSSTRKAIWVWLPDDRPALRETAKNVLPPPSK